MPQVALRNRLSPQLLVRTRSCSPSHSPAVQRLNSHAISRYQRKIVKRQRQRKLAVLKKVSVTSSSSEAEEEYFNETDNEDEKHAGNPKTTKYSEKLKEMIAPMSTKFNLHKEYKKLEYLCAFFACASHRTNVILRSLGALSWLASVVIHFAFDVNEAIKVYGYTFLAAQFFWLLNFVVGTLAMRYRVLPWLLEGMKELRHDECYEKTITNVLRMVKKIPYWVLAFGFVGSGAQHLFLYIDDAFNGSYNSWMESKIVASILLIVRFVTAAHIYSAYLLFWMGPTAVMMACGYAMSEFLDQFDAKIRDTNRITSFKEAISLYSKRAKFVKTSSSKCLVILSMQLLSVVICFGLNTYVFLFSPVRRYLHVWHSIVPLLIMVYPLCTAAWVTKQYTWFIIVVVRAWVHRDDLDSSSSDEDSGIDEMKTSQDKKTFAGKSPFFSKKKLDESISSSVAGIFKSGRPKSAHFDSQRKLSGFRRSSSVQIKDRNKRKSTQNLMPWQKAVAEKQLSDPGNIVGSTTSINSVPRFASTVAAATAINKFKNVKNRPRFNFEKFLSYLESMRSVVGFSISGIMVTWDLVSTTLFLLFSIIAVFMQESIFGDQKSTLTS
eukprot:TCONS_00068687-protein